MKGGRQRVERVRGGIRGEWNWVEKVRIEVRIERRVGTDERREMDP